MTTTEADIRATLGLDRTGRAKPPIWKKWWFWTGGAVLLLVAYVFLGSGDEAVTYDTKPAKRDRLVVQVTATGKLQPQDSVDVGAEISGRIVEVLVDFNAVVKTGDVLARIDTTQLEARRVQSQATLAAARAQVAQAEATVDEMRAKLKRMKELAERRTVSEQDLETAQANLNRAIGAVDAARAQVALSEAQLNSDEANVAKATIRSPIDGVVLSRVVEPGQTVAASFQTPVMFTLASDLTKLELLADIDEADIGQVGEGQPATFTVDAFPNRTFEARLTQLRSAPKDNAGVVTYEAVFAVDNQGGLLRPGMTATAEITVRTVDNALLVANGALRFTPPDQKTEDGENAKPVAANDGTTKGRLWTLGLDGVPVAHEITIGATDGDWTEVLSGDVKEGQEFLTDVKRPAPEDGG